MPEFLLIIIMGIALVVTFMKLCMDIENRNKLKKSLLLFTLAVVVAIGGSIWMYFAWDQDIVGAEYYYIQTVSCDNGTIMQVINTEDGDQDNVTSHKGKIFVNGTIVKKYRHAHWKNGIYWTKTPLFYECLVPNSSEYAEAKEQVKNEMQECDVLKTILRSE